MAIFAQKRTIKYVKKRILRMCTNGKISATISVSRKLWQIFLFANLRKGATYGKEKRRRPLQNHSN